MAERDPMNVPLPPPPLWDADLWLMFRGGCVEDGLRDPDDLRREQAEFERTYDDWCTGLEAPDA